MAVNIRPLQDRVILRRIEEGEQVAVTQLSRLDSGVRVQTE